MFFLGTITIDKLHLTARICGPNGGAKSNMGELAGMQ